MSASKTISSLPYFKFKTKRTKDILFVPVIELIHPRVKVITRDTLGEKAPESLLALMYSQENEVLFI